MKIEPGVCDPLPCPLAGLKPPGDRPRLQRMGPRRDRAFYKPASCERFSSASALLRNSCLRRDAPLSPLSSAHTDCLGFAECVAAVHPCDADPGFCGLAVGISCRDALTERLEATHLCFDPASDVVSGPALPECPTVSPGGAQGFVSCDCGRLLSTVARSCRSGGLVWAGGR